MRPSRENATEATAPLWPLRGSPRRRGADGLVTSHSSAVLSNSPVARVFPSGENATVYTLSASPRSGLPSWLGADGLVTSQSCTVPSALPLARSRRTGDNATHSPPLRLLGSAWPSC